MKHFIFLLCIIFVATFILSGCINNANQKPSQSQNDSDQGKIDKPLINGNTEEWIEISVFTQQYPEPWGNDDNIKKFFEQRGVVIYNININSRIVCEALNCPSYELKEILVSKNDINKAIEILNKFKTDLGIPIEDIKTKQEYTSNSWKTIISEKCLNFNDGCNECWREKPKDIPACTKKGCSEYQKPYCLD